MERHVTVVGAGIIGMCAASYLQRAGRKVTMIDSVAPGDGCSFGNAGGLSPGACVPLALPGVLKQVPNLLFDRDGPLVLRPGYLPRALPWLWRFARANKASHVEKSAYGLHSLLSTLFENDAPLLKEAKAEDLFRRNGQLYVYSTEAGFEGDAMGRELRRRRGIPFEILSGEQLRQMEPDLKPIFKRAMFMPEHGNCMNPFRLVTALADAFRRNGGEIIQSRVDDVVRGNGAVEAIQTEAGSRRVDDLVIAAGAWSHRLARKFGHKVPLESQRGYHVTLENAGAVPNRGVMWAEKKFLTTPMEMGVRVAGTGEFAGLEAPPDYRRADMLVEQASKVWA
ncbi:MAG: NAD(P)/FAD-dependent oxidoreductase, partial [Alphaproteobacteria bacterium]